MLRQLGPVFDEQAYPDVLVGLNAPDDAVVYRLSPDRALVVTTDFFTPIVDDPYTYGAIAATNALSDVYAMGGEVLFALNIAAFPENLPADIVTEILRGGAEQVRQAGSVIAGGHTVKSPEPLYGLAVIGEAHPDRIFRKTGAQPGDALVLSKPLGTGLVTTALKREQADAAHVAAAVASMLQLNRAAARAGLAVGVRCATDITGFGLVGHAVEMAAGSTAALQLSMPALPLLPGARQYAEAGMVPGGTESNRAYYGPQVQLDHALTRVDEWLLHDPQTSGGLLLAVPAAGLDPFMAACAAAGHAAWVVGQVTAGRGVFVNA